MKKETIDLGTVEIPEKAKKWIKYVTKEGLVKATPGGGVKKTPEELEESKAKRKEAKAEKVAKNIEARKNIKAVNDKYKGLISVAVKELRSNIKSEKAFDKVKNLEQEFAEKLKEAELTYNKLMGRA